MRGLIEVKLLWLGLATYVAYSSGWVGASVVGIQFVILFLVAWRPQKIALLGYASLLVFAILVTGVDLLTGDLNPRMGIVWFLVGACYIILYEYIALYELSAFLSDYGMPKVVVSTLNFGIRFIPLALNAALDSYLGLRAKGKLPKNVFGIAKKVAPTVMVMLLHKFEDMWISYNIRQVKTKRFNVLLNMRDILFGIFCLLLVLIVTLVPKQ